MYELTRKDGIVTGVRRLSDGAWSNFAGSIGSEFLKWNDAQPPEKKLDLSDKPPEPPPRDTELETIDVLILKDDGGTITNAEKLQLVILAVKRLRRRGAL